MKKSDEEHVEYKLNAKPVTYPLEFNKMEENLVKTKDAFTSYLTDNIEDLAERNWAQETIREFINLRNVISLYPETAGNFN